jgi:phage gp29-like protein
MNYFKRVYNKLTQGKKLTERKSTRATQLHRIRENFESWRNAIKQAEQDYMPFRVEMQRIYNDTVLNGHVFAAMEKRKNLSLLKDFWIGVDKEDENITKLFKNQDWFFQLCSHILDAKAYGYNLINWSAIEDSKLKEIVIYPRHLVSPDRRNYTEYANMYTGKSFDDPELHEWTLYVDTPTENGQSPCGYGYLYRVAAYEIVLRNTLGDNNTYNELYGLPFVHAKTSAQGEDRETLKSDLDARGGNTVLISDLTDEIEFLSGTSNGQGHLTFDNLEKRCEQKISKIILGHADAMDSTAGKLGNQGTEDDGVGKALSAIEAIDNAFLENIITEKLFPKLRSLGFPIPEGYVFKFKNDKEVEEAAQKKNESNKLVADTIKQLSDSGFEVDPMQIEELTGFKVKKKEVEQPVKVGPVVKNKLDQIYL